MRKKGIVGIVIAATLVMTMLAGCGGSGSAKGGDSAKSSSAKSSSAAAASVESTSAKSASAAAESAESKSSSETAVANTGEVIEIGYVNPTTGPLAGNGEGCDWVVKQIESYVNDTLGGIEVDGAKKNIKVIVYDSASDQATCAEMADKLCVEDEVDLIVAIQTPETVIPVEAKAEQYGIPCVGIQAPVNPCAFASDDHQWTVHAFWTIEQVPRSVSHLPTTLTALPGIRSSRKISRKMAMSWWIRASIRPEQTISPTS